MKSKFAVIGLGSFGSTVAKELQRLGNEVLGIDQEESKVNALADQISHAVIGDVRDERVLQELGLQEFDGVVVAIGEHLESNILCTLALKQMGAKCVWVKALTASHQKILARLGADRIINPEHEMGVQVAQTLNYPMVIDYISLGNDYFIVEIGIPDRLDQRPLPDLQLTERYDIRYLVLKRGRSPLAAESQGIVLRRGDRLVLMGHLDKLRKLAADLQ